MRPAFLIALTMSAAAPVAAQTQTTVPGTAPTEAPAAADKCDRPVYLVVMIDHLDRTKSKAYGEGLRSSGIVKRNGGEYKVVGAPLMTLEGDWPKDRSFLIEQYPCYAAFKAMWFSDEYQNKLKPLRAGSGTYTITVFDSYRPSAK